MLFRKTTILAHFPLFRKTAGCRYWWQVLGGFPSGNVA